MPAASSKARAPRTSSPRRAIPIPRAWSIPCRGWASAPGAASSGCARSRAPCPRSWPTPRAAASTRAARRSPTSAARQRPASRRSDRTASCGVTTMSEKLPEKLLELDDLAVHFKVGSALKGGIKTLKAVDGVTLDIKPGECLGLVGESGCGKSTLALSIMGLQPPTRGHIRLNGHELSARDRMETARTVQMVFQDPYASLNPRQTVRRTLADPLRLHGITNSGEVGDRRSEERRGG